MEARRVRPMNLGLATAIVLLFTSHALAQFGPQQQHVAHSQNFIVFAASPKFAAEVSQAAERYRKDLAVYWIGKELPAWSQRCPLHVTASPRLGAGGETRFSLMPGGVGNWMMSVQGTEQRVLDSVLPHEITHTIFATHFARYNKYVPRWADEGACTTVEHIEEKGKHVKFLQSFLRTGRGIPFNKMFTLKDYPDDILPLYAQGHSVVQFLLDQGGPKKFIAFLEEGMRTDAWQTAMKNHYEYATIGELQSQWNRWLRDGSPESLFGYAPSLQGEASASSISLASNSPSNASPDRANSNVQLGSFERRTPAPETLAQATPSPLQGLEGASFASGESYYRDRLRAVSSGTSLAPTQLAPTQQASAPLRAVGANSTAPNQPYPLHAYQTGRPNAAPPQHNNVQVLDWGNSQPVAGIATQPDMVPLMR